MPRALPARAATRTTTVIRVELGGGEFGFPASGIANPLTGRIGFGAGRSVTGGVCSAAFVWFRVSPVGFTSCVEAGA